MKVSTSTPPGLSSAGLAPEDSNPVKLSAQKADSSLTPEQNPSHAPKSFLLVEVPNRKAVRLSSAPFPESVISRFTTKSSAVAFPRILGIELGLQDPPRLSGFGWNTGMRPERMPNFGNRLFTQVSAQDAVRYINVYFDAIWPIFGVLQDRTHVMQICVEAWRLGELPIDVEAIICGMIALGSLFSPEKVPWAMEAGVVDQGLHLLDISMSWPPSQLSLKFVMGWLLRALYLRCTARPHLSWIASCNAVHIAEAIGLHQDVRNLDSLQQRPQEDLAKEAGFRRKTFWTAMSLNRLFSTECGRTPLRLDFVTCPLDDLQDQWGSVAHFVDLCECLPDSTTCARDLTGNSQALGECLQRISDFAAELPALTLFKAEVCFTIYRKMRFFHMTPSASQIDLILDIIKDALPEAQSLSHRSWKWWTVVGVPFQSICVLIAIDTPASLALLTTAMETLAGVAGIFDTHLTREALRTAAQLIRGLQKKKSDDIESADRSLENPSVAKALADIGAYPLAQPEHFLSLDWLGGVDSSWMDILFDLDMDQQML
ncbi:MAG: hypothetical protein M1820_002853 [Bogoriella megaspora]|nr:MAG: hypothetical protein M1820_002853 [Bogoriella megaspora]